jgi:hypothetical protein
VTAFGLGLGEISFALVFSAGIYSLLTDFDASVLLQNLWGEAAKELDGAPMIISMRLGLESFQCET